MKSIFSKNNTALATRCTKKGNKETPVVQRDSDGKIRLNIFPYICGNLEDIFQHPHEVLPSAFSEARKKIVQLGVIPDVVSLLRSEHVSILFPPMSKFSSRQVERVCIPFGVLLTKKQRRQYEQTLEKQSPVDECAVGTEQLAALDRAMILQEVLKDLLVNSSFSRLEEGRQVLCQAFLGLCALEDIHEYTKSLLDNDVLEMEGVMHLLDEFIHTSVLSDTNRFTLEAKAIESILDTLFSISDRRMQNRIRKMRVNCGVALVNVYAESKRRPQSSIGRRCFNFGVIVMVLSSTAVYHQGAVIKQKLLGGPSYQDVVTIKKEAKEIVRNISFDNSGPQLVFNSVPFEESLCSVPFDGRRNSELNEGLAFGHARTTIRRSAESYCKKSGVGFFAKVIQGTRKTLGI